MLHILPPTDHTLFEQAKIINTSKNHGRILHIGGKAAVKDRNGTNTVIDMLQYSTGEYEVVVKSQTELKVKMGFGRLKLDINNVDNNKDLYTGFDAIVMPRRYAGLCLPMNEALMASLPVFMTNISPNNQLLPEPWLAESSKIDELMTRTMIDVYSADPQNLAKIVDDYMEITDKTKMKQQAFDIGFNNFSVDILKPKYLEIMSK